MANPGPDSVKAQEPLGHLDDSLGKPQGWRMGTSLLRRACGLLGGTGSSGEVSACTCGADG